MKTLDAYTRIQLKNILFATDFSPAEGVAIPYAGELARRYGAKLHVVHVRPPVIGPLPDLASRQGVEEAAKIDEEQQRRGIAASFPGIQLEVLIREGDLWSNLAAAIGANCIDLIVIGTRGHSGIANFFLGSAAEEILQKAVCPVLTVGPHSPAGPKRGWEFTKILFATDLSSETVAAPYAISLAQEYQARLTLLHVIERPQAADFSRSAELLRNLVPEEAELWCVPEYLIELGSAAEKILEIAAERQVDLIVMGAHRPGGFPGATIHLPITTPHKVVSQSKCPVLTVRG